MSRATIWLKPTTVYNSWLALYSGDWEAEIPKLERRHKAKATRERWQIIYDDLYLQIFHSYKSQHLDCCTDS